MSTLSQRHRPRRFADVTGQRHVTDTLRAQVATSSLGHAFLFSGPRGIGKTTCARILAKALECHAPEAGEPCGTCSSCVAFHEGKLFDVIEIDAATHTQVEKIREGIIEHVRFAPTGKRKVYILDEAHMLSTASWNALLKTLEEPPVYAFFIFATTEWHKVPPTILSRCQRFEFRRIQADAMLARLEEIARLEGCVVERAALALIVSRAEGCLRDAETLLAQIMALAENGKISLATTGLVIPFSSLTHALRWLELCASPDRSSVMSELTSWQDAGISFVTLFDDVLSLLKRLLLASVDGTELSRWKEGTDEDKRLASLANVWTSQQIHDIALMLMERRRDLKLGMDPLFLLLLAYTATPKVETPSIPTPSIPAIAPPLIKEMSDLPNRSDSSPDKIILTLSHVRREWTRFIQAVEEKNHSLPVILNISKPDSVEGTTLTLRFPYPFHRDKVIADIKNKHLIEACGRSVFGVPELLLEGIVQVSSPEQPAASGDVVENILQAFGGAVIETSS